MFKKHDHSKLVPGALDITMTQLGRAGLFIMILRIACAYKRTMFYLLRKRGLRAVLKFLYVKIFVPTGEGAGAAFYFMFGWLIRRFPKLAPFPRYVEIETTTVCNRKCIMCEHTYWKDQEVRHLSFDEFKKTVDQFPKLTWVNLTGEGAAFLNKDYLKMIKYLKDKDTPVFLVDHFEDIDKETGRELIKMNVDGLFISMDAATKETYEKIKVGCNFDRVLENIRNFIELKQEMKSPIPEICFRYIINSLNVHELPQYLDLVHSFGTRKWLGDGSHVEFVGLLEFPQVKHLQISEIPENIIKEVMKKKREYDIHVLFSHTKSLSKNPSINTCLCWLEPYIIMGGYVLPDCAVIMSNQRGYLRKTSFGCVFEKLFKEIWNSERYRKFRQTVNNPNAKVPLSCRGCRAFDTTEREKKYGIDETL